MTVSGFKVTLFNWNETGNNSKLKLSKANIKKQTVLIEECEAHYEAAGVPLPRDFIKSVSEGIRKIRNAAAIKVKSDASNAAANAARSALRKKGNDPDQHLNEAEQVKYEKDRASVDKDTAKVTDLRKRDADPEVILHDGDQARVTKRRVLDAKGNATEKAIRDFKKTMQGRLLRRFADTEHGQSLFLPIDAGAFIVAELALSALQMTFGGERNANKIIHRLRSLFHVSNTPPDGLQMVMVEEEVLKKVLVPPATMLEEATIQGRPLLPGGIPHLKHIDKLSNSVWAHPGLFQCLAFYFRHHGGYYKLEPGTVAHAYCIFDTNDRFDLFEQHVWHGLVGSHCELLCRAKADEFIAPDACIEITIGDKVSFEDAAFRLIRNNGDMETPLDFPIPR